MRIGFGSINGVWGSHEECKQTWENPIFHAPPGGAKAAARRPMRLAERLFWVCSHDGSGWVGN